MDLRYSPELEKLHRVEFPGFPSFSHILQVSATKYSDLGQEKMCLSVNVVQWNINKRANI